MNQLQQQAQEQVTSSYLKDARANPHAGMLCLKPHLVAKVVNPKNSDVSHHHMVRTLVMMLEHLRT